MNLAFARALVQTPHEATIRSLYKDRHPGVFWVDWREADDDIVMLAADAMGRGDLTASWQESGLQISFDGRLTPVPLEQKPGEQDITLAALNRALEPGFELRWIRASEGGDTLAFQILPSDAWRALEAEFGAAAAQAFARLDPARPLFGEGSASQQPEEAMRAATVGSIGPDAGSASPLLASVRYRLINAAHAALTEPGSIIVSEPLAGDLRVAFEIVDGGALRLLTQADLATAAIDRVGLHERARANCAPLWTGLRDSGGAGLARFHTPDRADTSSMALHGGFWEAMTRNGHRMAVAFPRRDLVLFCDGTAAIPVSALVEMVERFDPADPETLSRLIYVWQGEGWAVRELAPYERAFRTSPLWRDAERGDLQAQYNLAHKFDAATHYAEAIVRYQRIAEQVRARPVDSRDMYANGSAAMCNLATKFEHGLGVPQDLKLARQWYMRSAAMGNCVAQYDLGMMYAAGRGVPVDPELAVTWLQQSAQQGFEPAREQLLLIEQARLAHLRRR